MSKIKIICDSMSDLTKEQIEKYDIEVLPLTVILEDKEYKDGIDFELDEFYKILEDKKVYPKTSQVTYGQFKTVFDKYIAEGRTIFYVASSANATGSYQSAVMAKNDTDGEIYLYDASNLTFGAGIFVLRAAELVEQGKSVEEIIPELDLIKEKYCLVFSIDSLNHLQKGGRISSTKAVLGNILNVKPICEVKDGLVTQLGQVRGKKNIINKLIEATEELTNGQIDNKVMYVGYMDNVKEKDALIEVLKEKYNPEKIGTFRIGSCIGSHSGPGVLGILSFKK
ncbi:DegV family protein [Intestinibacter sp.]|uniref:DegV family protein n=1 Tax=Intestinibacter sp. TaxID=1965304 RepID=UPI002A748C3D|nr:DegV family protein [Intestinibacter sp.]MDY2736496.1 DegV family protein [Intestinibacter sp.]MDY4576008.1 DegV family protein [Intestinibacter sp.]